MAESRLEQLFAAFEALLTGLVSDGGATVWYSTNDPTRQRVIRSTYFDDPDVDTSLEYIICIRVGDELHRELATGTPGEGGRMQADPESFVYLYRKFSGSDDPFVEQAEPRELIVNRMVRDVLRRVFLNPTLGLTFVENVSRDDTVVDRSRFLEGWAVAEIRFVHRYNYPASTP